MTQQELQTLIDEYITINEDNDITGGVLNSVLQAMATLIGVGYDIMGIATPSTNPGTPTTNVMYIAGEGTYTDFGTPVTVSKGDLCIFTYNGEWAHTIINLASWANASNQMYYNSQAGSVAEKTIYAPEFQLIGGGCLKIHFDNKNTSDNPTLNVGGTGAHPMSYRGALVNATNTWAVGETVMAYYDAYGVGIWRLVSLSDTPDLVNVNDAIHNPDAFARAAAARAAVPAGLRKPGLQITYLLAAGWMSDQFIGDDVADWADGDSWKVLGPVSVSQNTSTGHSEIHIGSDSYPVANVEEVSQLEAKVYGNDVPEEIPVSFTDGKYYNANGTTTDNAGSKYTPNAISLVGINKIYLAMVSTGTTSSRRTLFFDSGGSVALDYQEEALANKTTEIDTTNFVSMKVSCLLATTVTITYDVHTPGDIGELQGAVQELQDEVEQIQESFNAKLLAYEKTANLLDENKIQRGKYIDNYGTISEYAGWAISPFIPVVSGSNYYISAKTWGRDKGLSWFDENKELISGGATTIAGLHTAPSGASYLVFNLAQNNVYSEDVMVVEGTQAQSYVPYNQTRKETIKDFKLEVEKIINEAPSTAPLIVTKNGNDVSVSDGITTINAKLENNVGYVTGGNPVFNFTDWAHGNDTFVNTDDIAPIHAYNTTIGANHAQPIQRATITGHGLGNTDIGTRWEQNGIGFYVMNIIDANRVVFLSENRGTASSPAFVQMSTGTITRNGNTLSVSSLQTSQLWPAVKNHSVKIMINGVVEMDEDGAKNADFVDIVESYGIMNPSSVLDNTIARAGQDAPASFDGNVGVIVENIYRFTRNMSVLVISSVIPVETIAFQDIMFSQFGLLGTNDGVTKHYIPNSIALAPGYNFQKPTAIQWGSSVPSLWVTTSKMQDTSHPVNRVVETRGTIGFAIGFVTDYGVGKSLLDYTNETIEIRNSTGKVYPHGVGGTKVGTTLSAGQMYSAVMFRCPFVPENDSRLWMYHFDMEGTEYVFVDYSASVFDKVLLDDSFNGRKVEVVESLNAELKTDVYNGGFYVNATYVEGETCYLVAKIK